MWCFRNFRNSRPYAVARNSSQYLQNVGPSYNASENINIVPEYPQIKEKISKRQKKEEEWIEQIQNASTVEEKLIKINMPRYYGYKVVELTDEKLPYNALPAVQHYTRTYFEAKQLDTETSNSINPADKTASESLVNAVHKDVEDSISFSNIILRKHPLYAQMTTKEKDYKLGQIIVEQINRIIINGLSSDFSHLHEFDIDYNPRHEAFWSVGGINPPKNVVKGKEGREWQKKDKNEPVNRWMQYIGSPYLCLRHQNQLQSWIDYEALSKSTVIPETSKFNLDPRTLGYSMKNNVHGTNIPGFWPSESKKRFGFLNICPRNFLTTRPSSYGLADIKSALPAQAIQASYAWLLALANYNGFNTFNDITYPMNTQTVITNGRNWSFFEYQLNTLLIHSNNVQDNPKVNHCRGTADLQLYENVDDEGKCIGFNTDVLKQIISLYTNIPSIQSPANELQPYLNENCKLISNYKQEDKRVFLENTFKHLSSKRARHLELPEIYLWEKIYKIDQSTRALEPRRRFFELGINPWQRTLDQHQKEYIPRCKRTLGPKDKKNKWKQTYYP